MPRKAGKGFWVVTGIKEVDQAIKALPKATQKKVLRQAMRASMKPMLSATKARAPVDTGRLKSAIKLRAMKRKGDRVGVLIRAGKGDFKGETFYGAFIEYGTATMAAKPFMRPAFDEYAPSAREQALKLILEGIDTQVKALRAN